VDACGELEGHRRVVDVGAYDDELVATEAADNIGGAGGHAQAMGGLDEELVAGDVVGLLLGGTIYVVGEHVSVTTGTATPSIAGRRSTPSTTSPTSPSTSLPQSATPSLPGSGNQGGPSTGNGSTSWATVAAAIDPGVVDIETRVSGGIGAGTGMVLTADGEIITNNHVIDGASQIVVTTVVDGKTYRANVVGADPADDIAVIKLVGASGLATIPIGNSDDVKVGDQIAAIGNAGGQGGDPAIAPGTVTALHQQITASDPDGSNSETLTDVIQVAADMQPGDSGGALADVNGKAIGINAAASAGRSRYRTTTNQGFAIPMNKALAIAQQLVATGSTGNSAGSSSGSGSTATHGYLGVQVRDGSAGGAQIVTVVTAGPAAGAGLQAGAVITAVDGTAVASASDLTTILQQHAAGDRVAVGWTGADGTDHKTTITLGG
jgi:S1-C subfamily serine protease